MEISIFYLTDNFRLQLCLGHKHNGISTDFILKSLHALQFLIVA